MIQSFDTPSGVPGQDDQATVAEWVRVRSRLRAEFGETAYRSWLKPLVLEGVRDGVLCVSVPTRFMRDWIDTHYAERIRSLWSAENPDVPGIVFVTAPSRLAQAERRRVALDTNRASEPNGAVVDAPATRNSGPPPFAAGARPVAGSGSPVPTNRAATGNPGAAAADPATASHGGSGGGRAEGSRAEGSRAEGNRSEDDDLVHLGAPLDPRFTFDNFIVGKPNELAVAAAHRVAEAVDVSFNPLFLYSGVGLGKTHLMHAIAWHIRQRTPDRRVLYLSAEKFTNLFIQALRHKTTAQFKDRFRSVDILMVDDVQFIIGKDSTQEEFFHTFNALIDQNSQIVLSADKSPSDMEGLEERIRSRLGWGLVADIHPMNYELRFGILQSKAERQAVDIPERVLEFLAHRITSNVRELEGALNRLVAHATLVSRPISIESAQDVLADLLRANDKRVSIPDIQKQVAEHFNVRISDMTSPRRARAVARPRQVAMYLSKQLTPKSLPDIGRAFGGRDHTTVMHAVRKIEQLRAADPALSEDIDLLRRILEA